ncbi:HAD-IIA family hydrolase [Nocardioides piscis]|uniref:HAD-IIA family hydrolase n=2 Tax=Nocardioides piscis TaxID=2714938 RepID=A0A6G7YL23_9ACTN|nr:HAD-IIA family hydrolase [Nocardioides piscis]
MFDLDGVVYVGGESVAGVSDRVRQVRDTGAHVAFVTNNASRSPEQVAAKLVKLGVAATSDDVVTSAQAAARLLRDRFGDGAAVWLLGGPGLEAALLAEGLVVAEEPQGAVAVVSGYGPDVLWKDVMRAATMVRDGLPYVASNTDLTIPTAYGLAPGHGVLVRTIADFAGVEPTVAGKPARPLMDETIRRVGGERPLMVGDRLDTDIEGARAAGIDSMLVLTGVTGLSELVSAQAPLRPDFIAPDLAGLFEAHPVPERDGSAVHLGGWTARLEGGGVDVSGHGSPADWWRVVATAGWTALDDGKPVIDVTKLHPPVAPDGGQRR